MKAGIPILESVADLSGMWHLFGFRNGREHGHRVDPAKYLYRLEKY